MVNLPFIWRPDMLDAPLAVERFYHDHPVTIQLDAGSSWFDAYGSDLSPVTTLCGKGMWSVTWSGATTCTLLIGQIVQTAPQDSKGIHSMWTTQVLSCQAFNFTPAFTPSGISKLKLVTWLSTQWLKPTTRTSETHANLRWIALMVMRSNPTMCLSGQVK